MAGRSDSEQRQRDHVATVLDARNQSLAADWLVRLRELLTVRENEIFPSTRLLDHIPNLIVEIGRSLASPETESFAAKTQVFAKAAELGDLRFEQRATVHQLLREYDLLSDVLSQAVLEATADYQADHGPVDPLEALRVLIDLRGAIRVLQSRTVDRFVGRYADMVRLQTEQLRDFNLLISHELRQPLGVLRLTAELLDQPNADVAQFAATLSRNVEQLTGVVGKLERLAGLGGSGASVVEQTVDLAKLVQQVVTQLEAMASARHVRLEQREPLPVLVADPARLELVFTNLLVNAIKYSDAAKADRRVIVRPSITGDDRVAVAIEDNGIGLPDEAVPQIFNRYYRLPDSRGEPGLGLGLAIVRECMQAMDGQVQADSRRGEGTTFLLTWPIARLAEKWPAVLNRAGSGAE